MKKFFIFVFLFIALERFCHYQTDGFTITKIHSSLPYNSEWNPISLNNDDWKIAKQILQQKFFYLARGGSCYAFESEDGRYVIKFFKHHHLRPLFKNSHKGDRVFLSCKLAFDDFKEETGLIYLHLNKTNNLRQTISIVDKIGIEHSLDLDGVEFILQKKAEMAYPYLNSLMQQGELEKAKRAIKDILQLMQLIDEKGYADLDPNFETNIGFVDGRPIKIDVGPLVKTSIPYKNKQIKKWIRFKEWLKTHHPALFSYVEQSEQEAANKGVKIIHDHLSQRSKSGAS